MNSGRPSPLPPPFDCPFNRSAIRLFAVFCSSHFMDWKCASLLKWSRTIPSVNLSLDMVGASSPAWHADGIAHQNDATANAPRASLFMGHPFISALFQFVAGHCARCIKKGAHFPFHALPRSPTTGLCEYMKEENAPIGRISTYMSFAK